MITDYFSKRATARQDGNRDDEQYNRLITNITDRARQLLSRNKYIFTVRPLLQGHDDLFSVYLDGFPPELRQYHTCSACRDFINTYGNLAVVDKDGYITPLFWAATRAPERYWNAIDELEDAICGGKVDGVFHSSQIEWGKRHTGCWHHFAFTPDVTHVHRDPTKLRAEKRENMKMVRKALSDYSTKTIRAALGLMESGTVKHQMRMRVQANWLLQTHELRSNSNALWLHVAHAPANFCHIKSSVLGTLLDCIEDGLDLDVIKARMQELLDPYHYMRPKAAPTSGNIQVAEKIVEQYGLRNSLARRFAHMSDIKEFIWRPRFANTEHTGQSVFGHLQAKGSENRTFHDSSVEKMSWVVFVRDILPKANKIHLYIPNHRANYTALVTATYADAPPILKWDDPNDRNPVSTYVYVGGSMPSRWGLRANTSREIIGITGHPSQWGRPKEAWHKDNVILLIDGANDTRGAGLGLFPSNLIQALHPIRSTIEQFSRKGKIDGLGNPDNVAGLGVSKDSKTPFVLMVESGEPDMKITKGYTIDRWE